MDSPWPPWTPRGHWPEPVSLIYRVDPEGGPTSPALLREAAREAAVEWTRTGLVRLREAAEGDSPDFTIAWGIGRNGSRGRFGADPGIARTGPVEHGTTVLLDPDRPWELTSPSAPSLVHTIAHELGHALGLGHTERDDALLSPREDLRWPGPQVPDLAGLWSVYGPPDAPPAPGDLEILSADTGEPVAPPLRGIATRGVSAFALADADGNGHDDLLLWRTDRAGSGSLIVLRFVSTPAGPRLASTLGPFRGMAVPGALSGAARNAAGDTLFLDVLDDGRWLAYRFFLSGSIQAYDEKPLVLEGLPGDADGDGHVDLEGEGARARLASGLRRHTGDLDGDGQKETVRVAPGR